MAVTSVRAPGNRGDVVPAVSPAAQRRRLGAALRELRESRGLVLEDAARVLRCSTSKVSRLENGKATTPRDRDVRDLVEFYGGSTELSTELQALAVRGQDGGWWDDYKDLFTDRQIALYLQRFVALEEYASSINSYSTELVHGLLQTRAYVEAVTDLIYPDRTAEQRRRFVEFRCQRQDVLRRPRAPRLNVILDEPVLHYPVGGLDVLRGQLDHLQDLASGDQVTLTVLPTSTVTRAKFGGAFSIMGFDDPADSDVVYLEGRHTPTFLESAEDLEAHSALFGELESEALRGDDCIRFIKEARERLDD